MRKPIKAENANTVQRYSLEVIIVQLMKEYVVDMEVVLNCDNVCWCQQIIHHSELINTVLHLKMPIVNSSCVTIPIMEMILLNF